MRAGRSARPGKARVHARAHTRDALHLRADLAGKVGTRPAGLSHEIAERDIVADAVRARSASLRRQARSSRAGPALKRLAAMRLCCAETMVLTALVSGRRAPGIARSRPARIASRAASRAARPRTTLRAGRDARAAASSLRTSPAAPRAATSISARSSCGPSPWLCTQAGTGDSYSPAASGRTGAVSKASVLRGRW
jgi:hypothetical protein